MDNRRIHELLDDMPFDMLDNQLGFWRFSDRHRGREVLIVTDETHDRMRVMSPICQDSDLGTGDLWAVLSANFDRALDAKFAVGRGMLWALFMHPLSPLTDGQLLDAVDQVLTLAENYGGTYTSSHLVFGPGGH